MACILGLRVSPTYRRKGVGLKLVRSVEEWMVRNGAEYSLVATDKNNEASTKLFTLKSNYLFLSSLLIFVHPTTFPFPHNTNHTTKDIKIHKLNTAQAISLYTTTSKHRHLYLSDMDLILKDNLSLGTWVCYYKDQPWDNTINNIPSPRASNWIMFSIWNTCEAHKLQARNKSHHGPLLRFLTHTTLNQAREKIFPCLRARVSDALSRPLGFLFMYGLHGEGDSHSLGELMECVWKFTSRLGASVKDCKVIITELGFDDPLAKLVPQTPCMSCIHDLWYIKRISDQNNIDEKEDEVIMMIKGEAVRNVFVDPRDF